MNAARPGGLRDHFWLVRRLARVEKRHKLRVRKIDREHIAAQILVFVAVLTPVVISIAVHFWGRR
jgi:hypothetical protein